MKGLFMNNTALEEEIAKMTDTEVERQWSRAYHLFDGESFDSDHEARSDAWDRYRRLTDELKRRRAQRAFS